MDAHEIALAARVELEDFVAVALRLFGSFDFRRLSCAAPENVAHGSARNLESAGDTPAAHALVAKLENGDAFAETVLAVVLTGMGFDGLRGCERIYDSGGRILAQDEASAVVWGMPGSVAKEGLADKVLPLVEMAGEIVQCASGNAKDGLLAQPKRPATRMHGGNTC
jgi:hypothetical protein